MQTIQRDSIITFPFLNLTFDFPSCITIFGKCIYWYGIIIGIAFLLGILFCTKRCKKFGIAEDNVYDCFIALVPASIIGARLYYVLFNLDYYITHPKQIIAIWEGGLAIYGGIILGAVAIVLVCRQKKISSLAMIDLFIIACMLGQALGRWGNFCNREAFGAETDIFCKMGLTNPSGTTIYVHPTFLYESLFNFVGFILMNCFINRNMRKYNGQCLLIYFVWYGTGRFFIEGLRTDSLYVGSTNLRASQILSAILVIIGIVLLIINRKKSFSDMEASQDG